MKHKRFYYFGEDYLKRDYKEIYERVSRWITIKFNGNGEPFFRFNNTRYKFDEFYRNGGIGFNMGNIINNDGTEEIRLSGMQNDVYWHRLFVEIDEYGERIRVYQYIGSETLEE